MSSLYLRDLKDMDRESMENLIKKERPDLVPKMEEGLDITIGEYFDIEDFSI